MKNVLLLSSLVLCANLTACDSEKPVYDDTLNLTAVPVATGELAGRFYLRAVTNHLADLSFLGMWESASEVFWVVERIYDAENQTYIQTMDFCEAINYEFAGVTSTIPDLAYEKVETTDVVMRFNHETGAYAAEDILITFALQNLEDPVNAELPSNEAELDIFLQNNHVFDMDEDGNPGITIVSSGAIEANLFNISRIVRQIEGISLSADRLVGLMTTDRYTYVMVSDNPLMKPGRKYMPQHEDPKENWFEEIRIDDRQTCDNVMTFKDEGHFSRVRPF
tara:strand:- start:314 stop:1150 length:837 start_codon:yes stop_codon:yes gene_type:complete